MGLRTAIFLLIFSAGVYRALGVTCNDFPDDAGKIQSLNKSSSFIVSMKNESDDLNFDLRLVYTWDLQLPGDMLYDGFLYKYADRKEHAEGSDEYFKFVGAPIYMGMYGNYGDSSTQACDTESKNSLWAIAKNGTPVECAMPCSEYFPAECASMEVCSRRNDEGFLPLPKGTNRLEVGAKFGREYEMTILVYRHWQVLSEFHFESSIIFCREELIVNQNVDEEIAEHYCNKTQTMEYVSGPPSRLELHSVTHDLSRNRANVVVRWRDPYDVSSRVQSIERYVISTTGGEAESLLDNEHRCYGSYHCVEITNVEFEKMLSLKVTPYVQNKKTCQTQCWSYGYSAIMEYSIPDMDACNGTARYCDRLAICTDLPSANSTSAICSCPFGYDGNGINGSLLEGTGCEDHNACAVAGPETCANDAECIDLPPPSTDVLCSCKSNYIGSGYKQGTGCTKLSNIILISTVVPLALVATIFTIFLLRRIKITKAKSKRFSKFFVSSNVKYAAPTSKATFSGNVDRQRSEGTFGAEYEIERSRFQFTEILGRGNFGVVHKAAMKTNDGCKYVAVKTTAEPHSEEMEREFLAEIGLITTIGSHENLIGMIGCCTATGSIICLVTQFMKYGDLQHFLWDAREEEKRRQDSAYNLTEKSVYDVGEQVASGLEHLSRLRIIHGDIAARNILVDEGLKCKISDFGLANDVYRYGAIKGAREKKVPIKWISPERMLAGKVPITWRSDVWSYGILLFEAATLGGAPFSEVSQEELLATLRSGYRMPRPSFCTTFLYSVMMECWNWTPSKRPSFRELKDTMKAEKSSSRQRCYVNLSDTLVV